MSATETHPPARDSAEQPDDAPLGDTIDRALLVLAGVVVLGTIMAILDTTVVNVALKTLATSFNTTLPTIQWVATGYTLALAIVIPLSGWMADRFGTKRLYMTSIALFMVGSCLSGIAWSASSIIFFRVLQGLGGGMIMPTGMTILTRAAGPHRIGRVMSIIGIPMLMGPVLGPILGGWLVTDVNWRWIFYINIPIGIAALIYALKVLPKDVGSSDEPLDYVDLLLLSPGLALSIYGLAESSSAGGFTSPKVIIPLIVGIMLICAFVFHALRSKFPLIDLRLFKDRAFASSSVTLVLMIISVFGSLLLLPLYFQEVRGESALQSGLLLAPQGLGTMLAMRIAGRLADQTGAGKIVPWGLLTVGVSVLWLTQIGAHTSYVTLSIFLFLNGLGLGFALIPTFTGAMQAVKGRAVARASTALNVLQQAAASIGTAVLSVLLASAIKQEVGSGTSSTQTLTPAMREKLAPHMAAAYGHTFWWALGFIVIALIASLWLPKTVPEHGHSVTPLHV